MKEHKYYIAMSDDEQSIIIRALNDLKTHLIDKGKSTDAVDELIVKVGKAPIKKFKVVEQDVR